MKQFNFYIILTESYENANRTSRVFGSSAHLCNVNFFLINNFQTYFSFALYFETKHPTENTNEAVMNPAEKNIVFSEIEIIALIM